jgi:DNA excision repair protein ERCC-4
MPSASLLPTCRSESGAGAASRCPRTEPDPVVVIDTREQRPYWFPRSVVRTLRSGDYSIEGHEDEVAIERKSKADAYGTIGGGRDRFRREIERLARYDFAAIVVESSLPDFLKPPPHSQLHPHAAIGTLLGWCVRYRLPVLFAGDREHAQAATHHLLRKFAFYAQEGSLVR